MPIPRKATPEVCDKPADDYAYALMIGCIQSGLSFLGPFKAEDEALQAWDEHLEGDKPAAIVPLWLVDERAGPGTVHVTLGEHDMQVKARTIDSPCSLRLSVYQLSATFAPWFPGALGSS